MYVTLPIVPNLREVTRKRSPLASWLTPSGYKASLVKSILLGMGVLFSGPLRIASSSCSNRLSVQEEKVHTSISSAAAKLFLLITKHIGLTKVYMEN